MAMKSREIVESTEEVENMTIGEDVTEYDGDESVVVDDLTDIQEEIINEDESVDEDVIPLQSNGSSGPFKCFDCPVDVFADIKTLGRSDNIWFAQLEATGLEEVAIRSVNGEIINIEV